MSHINNPSSSIDSNEAALLTSLEALASGTGQAIVKTGSTTLGLVTFGDLTKSQADTYYWSQATAQTGLTGDKTGSFNLSTSGLITGSGGATLDGDIKLIQSSGYMIIGAGTVTSPVAGDVYTMGNFHNIGNGKYFFGTSDNASIYYDSSSGLVLNPNENSSLSTVIIGNGGKSAYKLEFNTSGTMGVVSYSGNTKTFDFGNGSGFIVAVRGLEMKDASGNILYSLPTVAGTPGAGQVITFPASGTQATWDTPWTSAGYLTGLTVGTTPIASGTDGYVLWQQSGKLAEIIASYVNTNNSIVLRDSAGNSAFNNVVRTVTQINSANQTIAMTYGSSFGQETYGTSNVTFYLPDATYLYQGEAFEFNNNSTGIITIYKHDGTTLVGIVISMGYGKVVCDNNSTVNGEWDIHFYIPSGASSQFVKGDGSLDSSTYLTSLSGAWLNATAQTGLTGDKTGSFNLTTTGTVTDSAEYIGTSTNFSLLSQVTSPSTTYGAANASYTNVGGSGNRTSFIVISSTIFGWTTLVKLNTLIDGDTLASGGSFYGEAVAGEYLRFDFGVGQSKILTEATWTGSSGNGVWQWQGSNDASSWTNIGSTFTWNSGAMTSMSANTTGYRYYQLLGVSGNTNGGPDIQEINFKIADAAAITYGTLQTYLSSGVGYSNLLLNQSGGFVGIGNSYPTALLSVGSNFTVNGSGDLSAASYSLNGYSLITTIGGSYTSQTESIFIGQAGNKGVTGARNIAIGGDSGAHLTSNSDNVFIGFGIGNDGVYVGSYNTCIGSQSAYNLYSGSYNTAIGYSSMYGDDIYGSHNVAVGDSTAGHIEDPGGTTSYNVFLGSQSANVFSNGARNIFLGAYSGSNQTTPSDILLIGNHQYANAATELTNSIIYGVMAATPASQTLRLNANVGINITPTALLTLAAGTATAGTAPLKITPGVNLTATESGAIESDGTHLYWTDSGGTRHQLDN